MARLHSRRTLVSGPYYSVGFAVLEPNKQVAYPEGFGPPTPSSQVWYRAVSRMFAVIHSYSLPLLQVDSIGRKEGAEGMLDFLKVQVKGTIADVRRLVYALRLPQPGRIWPRCRYPSACLPPGRSDWPPRGCCGARGDPGPSRRR